MARTVTALLLRGSGFLFSGGSTPIYPAASSPSNSMSASILSWALGQRPAMPTTLNKSEATFSDKVAPNL